MNGASDVPSKAAKAMAVGSIGSTPSFWQQDQSFWQGGQSESATLATDTELSNIMANAQATLSKGLASIANQAALTRTNNEISSIVQQVLQSASGSSTSSTGSTSSSSSSTSSSTSDSSSSSSAAPLPASLTGTTRLTANTSLSSLGILPGGTLTISASTNATTYTSTGTDTVGDLINAINIDLPTNAHVTASINAGGQLVLTSMNNKDSIAVVGSGTDAAAIGFGANNSSAQPTTPSSAGTTGSSTASSSTGTGSSAASTPNVATEFSKALAQNGATTAQSILSASGVSGTLINMII
jgi:hypothetical protein